MPRGLIHGLEAGRIRSNLERVRERVGPGVEILAATKYVPVEEMGALAVAGVELVGENRLQDLEAKREPWANAFEWDFIGNVQSRKVKRILPLVRLIHSVATDSVPSRFSVASSLTLATLVSEPPGPTANALTPLSSYPATNR